MAVKKIYTLAIIGYILTGNVSAQIELKWLNTIPMGGTVKDFSILDDSTYCITSSNAVISRSTNYGATWTTNSYDDIFYNIYKMGFVDKKHGFVFGENFNEPNGLLITKDGGKTWNETVGVKATNLYDCTFWGDDTILVTSDDGIIFYSYNGGDSWTSTDHQLQHDLYSVIATDNDSLFLLGVQEYQSGTTVQFRSTIFTWESESGLWRPVISIDKIKLNEFALLQDGSFLAVGDKAVHKIADSVKTLEPLWYKRKYDTIDIIDNGTYLISNEYYSLTTDGGENWEHSWVPGIRISKLRSFNKVIYGGGNNAGFIKSTDFGQTWTTVYPLFKRPDLGVYGKTPGPLEMTDENTVFAIDKIRKFVKTTDGGITWSDKWYKDISSIPEMASFINMNTGLVIADDPESRWYEVYKTADGAESFELKTRLYAIPNDIEMLDEKYGIIVGKMHTDLSTSGVVYYTTDGGESWNENKLWSPELNTVAYVNKENIYASGKNGAIIHSEDNGRTWKTLDSKTSVELLSISFADEKTGFCVGASNTVLKTTDGGENWEKIDFNIISVKDLYNVLIDVKFANKNFGILKDNLGIWITGDAGKTWEYQRLLTGLEYDIWGNRFIGVSYTGIVKFEYDNGFSSDEDEGEEQGWIIPQNVNLSQNYPNPFNPSTNIKFSIKEAGQYRLSVYNMLGEEVKTIVNKQLPAGEYTETFKADGLSSGVYIYRLSGNNINLANKMILLR